MKEPRDPVRLVRLRVTASRLIAFPTMAICAAWAGWPLKDPGPMPALADPDPVTRSEPTSVASLDISAFDAILWVVPAVPVATVVEPPKPPSEPVTALRLVGIIHEQVDGVERLRAAIYDPRSDRILVVADGDQIGSHTVQEVTAFTVELRSGRSTSRLLLDDRAKPTVKKAGRS